MSSDPKTNNKVAPSTLSKLDVPVSQIVKRYALLLLFVTFFIWSFYYLDIPFRRFVTMFGPLQRMFTRLFGPPDFQYIYTPGLLRSILQTFHISVVGTIIGLAFCVPLAWWASYNLSPKKMITYPIGRGAIVVARSIDWMIWAMLFTMFLGFGPLAGTLTIILGTIGFCGKIMAEEVESISMGPIEAIRSTGAGEVQVFLYGILPQVQTAWAGTAIYGWDSSFRSATVLGYVGAGGVGMYLRRTIQLLQYNRTGVTLLIILFLVIVSEVASAMIRKRLM